MVLGVYRVLGVDRVYRVYRAYWVYWVYWVYRVYRFIGFRVYGLGCSLPRGSPGFLVAKHNLDPKTRRGASLLDVALFPRP